MNGQGWLSDTSTCYLLRKLRLWIGVQAGALRAAIGSQEVSLTAKVDHVPGLGLEEDRDGARGARKRNIMTIFSV